jgi:hypothetical protein
VNSMQCAAQRLAALIQGSEQALFFHFEHKDVP